jgi:hypothetical protein
MVRILAVTSSPVSPSPPLEATHSAPSRSTTPTATPSTFGSATYSTGLSLRSLAASVELAEFVRRHGVVERQHRQAVPHRGEPLGRRGADALRRRRRAAQYRVALLELDQLAEQRVVLGIRDRRRVFHIVALIVRGDFAPQTLDPTDDGLAGSRLGLHTTTV